MPTACVYAQTAVYHLNVDGHLGCLRNFVLTLFASTKCTEEQAKREEGEVVGEGRVERDQEGIRATGMGSKTNPSDW